MLELTIEILGYSYQEVAEDYYNYPAANLVPFNLSEKVVGRNPINSLSFPERSEGHELSKIAVRR